MIFRTPNDFTEYMYYHVPYLYLMHLYSRCRGLYSILCILHALEFGKAKFYHLFLSARHFSQSIFDIFENPKYTGVNCPTIFLFIFCVLSQIMQYALNLGEYLGEKIIVSQCTLKTWFHPISFSKKKPSHEKSSDLLSDILS